MKAGLRLGVGGVLIVVAALAWVGHAMLSYHGDRAWQDGSPPAAVTVVAGHEYHVSSRSGPTGVTDTSGTGTLPCFYTVSYSAGGGGERQLTVTTVSADSRALHTLGSFIAPESGKIAVRCDGVSAVYVDDAADAPFDRSGLLVLLSILVGITGAILTLSALMDLAGPLVSSGEPVGASAG